MISDYSRDLLRSGIIELKAGNRETARRYMDRALYMASDHDVLAEAWYWMSQITDDPAGKRHALENCLSHDLRHARARRALAILDGRLKPDEIIDPEAPLPRSDLPKEAERFMCPKCGGRMHYAPGGQSLVCEYCARNQPVASGTPPNAKQPEQEDFLLAMATARGHARPLVEQVFRCQGCGAEFILPAAEISISCPYCGSPHVVSFDKSAELLSPDGILPHAFDQSRASSLLDAWLARKGPPSLCASYPPRALYLPLWTFDIGGSIDYTGEVVEPEDIGFGKRAPRIMRVTDRYPVMRPRLPIPASRKLSAPFVRLLPTFDLKALQPYDPRYLADWPAELYDIPLADASLDARSQGYAMLKRAMQARLSPVRLLSASSANLTIDSFELDLLPVWVSEVSAPSASGSPQLVLINGVSGDISGELAPMPSHSGKLLSWLSDLIAE